MQDDETEPGELPVSTSPFKQALGVSIALLAAYVPASDGEGIDSMGWEYVQSGNPSAFLQGAALFVSRFLGEGGEYGQ